MLAWSRRFEGAALVEHRGEAIDYVGAMNNVKVQRAASVAGVVLGGFVGGCGGSDAPKAWNALATCLAGPAAGAPLVERASKLRAALLASAGTSGADAWPARCNRQAEALYSATGDVPQVHRVLKEQVGCKDDGAHCTFLGDESFLSTTGKLWDAAQAAQLKAEPAADVAAPAFMPPPLADATSWKSFSAEPARVVGPVLNADGSAVLLLVKKEGSGRPRFCKLPAGLATLTCSDANASVPELPAQTVGLARDGRGVFAAGLTDSGRAAYNLETGERSDVHGKSPNLVSDGLAIESGTEPAAGPKGAAVAPGPQAPAQSSEKGFVAIEIAKGKSSRELKLAIEPVGTPVTLGNQIVYVAGDGATASLEARAVTKGRLSNVASIKGPFVGALHRCSAGSGSALATFDGHDGQRSAKPTAGAGKTQFTIAFRSGDSWSKAQTATLPFDRALDSDLVCTSTGASIAWIRPTADSVEVGRLDCNADGCKTQTEALKGIESKWWGGVAPLGDKVLLLWRSALGETRSRVAALSGLASASDQLLFDSADFGGPVAGEPMQISTDTAALFVFITARPVALRIGADGKAALLGG
jgi:hypothetical protein